jgi:hypothetical protein
MYRKAMDWWLGLPWYWKLLSSGLLIFIALLGFFALFTRRPGQTPASIPNLPPVDDLKDVWQKERELQIEIERRQKVIAKKLDASEATNKEAALRLEVLMQTETMEELDRLQKEWDL